MMNPRHKPPAPEPSTLRKAFGVSVLELKAALAIARAERRRFFRTLSAYAFRSGVPVREDWDAVADAGEVVIRRGI